MATNKQMDSVFFFLKKYTGHDAKIDQRYIWNNFVNKTPELGINSLLYSDILRKLNKDGYVVNSDETMYHLTVDGRNFRGYVYNNKWYRKLFNFNFWQLLLIGVIGAIIGAILTFIASK